MMSRSLSLARLVAMSALLLGMAVGCNPDPQPQPGPERARPDAERSTVQVSKSLGVRSNGEESVTITVTVRQEDGTPLEGRRVMVSVSGEGNTVTQPASPTDSRGVATAQVVSSVAGEKRVMALVEAEGGPVPLAAQPSIQFVVLPASRLAFTASPSVGTAGAPLGLFEVAVQNAYGEPVTEATGMVTLALGDAPATAVLEGELSAQVVNGVARFSELVLKRAGQGYTLVASAEGLTGAKSPPFEVSGAAPVSLSLAQLPATVEAGAAVQLELSARDAFGNVAPGYTGTVRFSSDDGTAELPADYTFTAADRGVHLFTGLTLKRAGARRVEVVDTAGVMSGTAWEVGVVAGPPAKLAFTGQPTSHSVRTPFEVAVQLRDTFDNGVAASEPVTLSVSEPGVTLDGPLTVALVDGVASFSGLSLSQQGTYTLRASTASALEGTSDAFTVTDDVAPAKPVLAQGATTTTSITVQWTAPGDDGALGTASSYELRYATTPLLTDEDFAAAMVWPSGAPQAAGSAESVMLEGLVPATTYYVALAVTDDVGNSVRSDSLPVSTQDALATSLRFTRQPQSGTAGAALPLVEVSILDQDGNVLTSSNAAVSLAVQGADGFGPFSAEAVNGVASFDAVRVDKAGTGYRLVATSGALTETSDAFDVAPAEVASFEVSGVPSPVTAHSSLSPVVTAKDAFGNVVTSYTGTVRFSSDDPEAVLPGDYTFTAADLGQHVFTEALVLKTVGARTVSVQDTVVPTLTGTLAVTVEAEVASQLVLSGLPASVVAGESSTVTVEARGASGNVATGYRGTVQFTSTDAAFVPPAAYTFTEADAGRKTFTVQLSTAGAQSLTVTDDSAPTPLSATVDTTVQPAAATMLVLSAPETGTSSNPLTLSVTAKDAYGNVAKGYTGTVHFSSSDPSATLPADYTFTTADEGSRQFSVTPSQSGTTTFSVEDTGNALLVASISVTVSPGPAVAFELASSQSPVDAGVSFSLQVTAKDQAGNVATGYTGTVRFASGDTAAVLPSDYTFLASDNGTHAFSVVLKTAGTHALTVAEHPSGAPSASIDLEVQPGPASRLEFRAQPANGTVRAALSEVVVAITDDHGNVITTDTTAVTLALAGGNAAASLGGTTTGTPVDGLARFSDLTVDQEGTGFQLQATGGTLTQATSSAFDIVDDLAPAAVSLSVAGKTSIEVTLGWTAVGDDGLLGTADEYDLRYSTNPIVDDASFSAATGQIVPAPQAPGSAESATVTGLTPSTTYYFALKTLDGAGNAGPLVSLSETTNADPCLNHTCTPSSPTCDADGVSLITYTSTCVDVDNVATCQESPTSTLCPGDDGVCFANTCDTAPPPAANALSFSELMHTPSTGTTEYIELQNNTDGLLDLTGVEVSYTQGGNVTAFTVTSPTGAPVVVDRRGAFVLAQNGEGTTNGGVTAHYVYGGVLTLENTGQLRLSYGATLVEALEYTVDFPQTAGRAMSLSSLVVGTQANAWPWYWCDADAQLAGGDYGSPGAANGTCDISLAPPVDFCNIQHPKSFPSGDGVYPESILAGSSWPILSRFQEPDLTDRNTSGNDYYPHVFAELGYGQDATNPAGWTWTPASFHSGYTAAGSNDDEMRAMLSIPSEGTWRYGFRYRFKDPSSGTFSDWAYCDQDGVAVPPAGNYGSVVVVPKLVISEFASKNLEGDGVTVDHNDEFIELYNPNDSAVDLTGWLLQYRSDNATGWSTTLVTLSGSIAARGFFLVAYQNGADGYSGTVTPDLTYSTLTSHTGGTLRIVAADGTEVDRLGWGTSNHPEGTAASSIDNSEAGASIERKALETSSEASMAPGGSDAAKGNGYDSEDNASDFLKRTLRDPQNASSPAEAP